jgi:hypothetical protein
LARNNSFRLERFRAKQAPVRVKKTLKIRDAVADHSRTAKSCGPGDAGVKLSHERSSDARFESECHPDVFLAEGRHDGGARVGFHPSPHHA